MIQLDTDEHDNELRIEFQKTSESTSLIKFNFLSNRWEIAVPLVSSRSLYSKICRGRYWKRDKDKPHILITSSTKVYLCPRCGGSGDLPQFRHVQEGICFLCWGTGGSWGTENSEGAINEFAKACNNEDLKNLYEQVKVGIQRAAKLRLEKFVEKEKEEDWIKRNAEMVKIRDRRKKKTQENRP